MARKRLPGSTRAQKAPAARSRVTSGIIGGILLGLGGMWLIWLLLHQFGSSVLSTIPIAVFPPAVQPATQIGPLQAEGITLGHSDQTPTLNQQQALVIAGQLEPNAAALSKQTSAQYVLLSYPNKSTPATHAELNNVPAWLVHYQRIPLEPADAAVDPTPNAASTYDVYVFLDANSGKELLVVQV